MKGYSDIVSGLVHPDYSGLLLPWLSGYAWILSTLTLPIHSYVYKQVH